jgi:hypothetical protein
LDVTMNQAVAGRKGTIAVFIETEFSSSVKVLDGEIFFQSKSTGETKNILPGEMISANRQGLSQISSFSIEDELLQWELIAPKAYVDKIRADINNQASINTAKTSPIGGITHVSKSNHPTIIWLILGGIILLLFALTIIIMTLKYKNKASTISGTQDMTIACGQISLINPNGAFFKLPLVYGSNILGRNPENAIYIEDPKLSSQHAELFVSSERYTITDLNSRNGTFVNGERITQCDLYEGDRIQIGDSFIII